MKYICILVAAMAVGTASASHASENWDQFRGPGARGQSDNSELPVRWTAEQNVLWERPLGGRGWSSPVVWENRIFVTAVENESTTEAAKKGLYFGGNRPDTPETNHRWLVYCLDMVTGEILWEHEPHRGLPPTGRHLKNSYASETPVVDDERLYVYFGNVGLFCYSHGGDLLWKKSIAPQPTRYTWGTAASPVLHEDRLYIVNDNDRSSFLAAINKRNGNEIWRVTRDEKSNWATPYVWENKLRTEIITPGTEKIRSYDLAGNLLYELAGCSSITIATPYSAFGMLYVSSGYVLDANKPVFAIRPGAQGDISLDAGENDNQYIAWCQRKAAPYNPSTLVYGDLLYVLLDRGYLACYDARTGDTVYKRQRLPRGQRFTASPFAYGGKIFCLNEDGVTFVVEAGREFKLLHTNPLGTSEMCMATPALVGAKLLIRAEDRLICVGS
jgi:outer membrane protein assembly factor BamB